jgi:hypothetical protein
MKINEVIVESKLKSSATRAMSNFDNWPDTYNDPYKAYRFGVAMAGAPDNPTPSQGPIGPNLTTVGYSDVDQEIINIAAKELGLGGHSSTGKGSLEPTTVNTQSPVTARGPIQKKR